MKPFVLLGPVLHLALDLVGLLWVLDLQLGDLVIRVPQSGNQSAEPRDERPQVRPAGGSLEVQFDQVFSKTEARLRFNILFIPLCPIA